ncbi:hypothetical protein F5Y04DRAFT_267817 [Hypomontagnella monticulosa]|nr:hypothetical protein F5Y04DRAFT_267817 [Hypomontagnella monticulosa]
MTGNWTAPAPHASNPGATQFHKPHGPPYLPTMAIVGGSPSAAVDDPIAAVLLLLFLASAGAHMAILKLNKQRNLKFIFSGMLFVLCLLRSLSLVARMVWASYPRTVNAIIAASVMTQCGSVLIFIINLFFAQRVLRAYHPRLGWHRGTAFVVWFLIACVLCCLIMAITTTIHSFFTLNKAARRADRDVQLFAGTYLACLAFLPVPVVVLAAATNRPHRLHHHLEKFGEGRWRAEVGLLVFASLVATLGAAFRVGVNFAGRPGSHPAWFHSRACYYGFNFVTDLVVSTAYLLARFDRRFVVPDGAHGPGDYSPIIPSAMNSNSNLVGKLPVMETARSVTLMRASRHQSRRLTLPNTPVTISMTAVITSSSSITTPSPTPSQKRVEAAYATDSSNTAVHNSPTTSFCIERKHQPGPPLSAHPSQSPPSPPQLQSHPHPNSHAHSRSRTSTMLSTRALRARGRRGVMMRMRNIRSEADARPLFPQPGKNSLRAPAPAHLGPPILPDLDLEPELLSMTLRALDSFGFDVRRASRSSRLSRVARMSRSGSVGRKSMGGRSSRRSRSEEDIGKGRRSGCVDEVGGVEEVDGNGNGNGNEDGDGEENGRNSSDNHTNRDGDEDVFNCTRRLERARTM